MIKDYLPDPVCLNFPLVKRRRVFARGPDKFDQSQIEERLASSGDEAAWPASGFTEAVGDHEFGPWTVLSREVGKEGKSADVRDQSAVFRRLDYMVHDALSPSSILPHAVAGLDGLGWCQWRGESVIRPGHRRIN